MKPGAEFFSASAKADLSIYLTGKTGCVGSETGLKHSLGISDKIDLD
ncbi:hypothetical protein [Sporosarcina sp. FA9]